MLPQGSAPVEPLGRPSRVRSALFAGSMAAWTALLGGAIPVLALLGAPPRRVRQVTRLWARGVVALLESIVGIRHVVTGRSNIPGRPCLIVCNHQSGWETITALLLFPEVAIVAKQELLSIPVFGWYLKRSPMIIIDRASSLESIRGMARQARAALADGRSVLIFPEGTRVAPDAPVRFRRGIEHLFRLLDVPVLAVVHDAGRCWRRDGLAAGTIRVRILAPVMPALPPGRTARDLETVMNAERP